MRTEVVKAGLVGVSVLFVLMLAASISLAFTTFVLFMVFGILIGHAFIEEWKILRGA